MNLRSRLLILPAVSMALASTPALADNLSEALSNGKFSVQARLRDESVDDSVNLDAQALTLRTRLGYSSASYKGFSLNAEVSDTRVVAGQRDYASATPGYAVVADPEMTEVTIANFTYAFENGLKLTGGRQRIIFDNARFVGNVGWRQKEQTFDALSLAFSPFESMKVNYAYIDRVKGITPAFDDDVSNHLLNLNWTGEFGTVVAYAYLLEKDATNAGSDTIGVRYSNKFEVTIATLGYVLEYADHSADAGAASFDTAYYRAEGSAALSKVTFRLGHEVLTSDGGLYGTQTPLATKHAFNGWADKFLGTPATGLVDTWAGLSSKLGPVNVGLNFHDFSAEFGGADYGSEIDLVMSMKFAGNYTAGFKFADYQSDGFSTDTTKAWLWVEARF